MSNGKFVVLGDVHIGARNASPVVCEYQLNFFENELIPYMQKHGIKTILQLGDLFDSRKFSSHVILYEWKTRFFDLLKANDIHLITLLGNHDIASRNSLRVNASNIHLSHYDNITIVADVVDMEIEGSKFLIVPWVCSENSASVRTAIENSDSLYCAGHFEFSGFEMQKGVEAHGADDPEEYSKFDMVFSGHYHTRGKKKNIVYTGVPYEMTWADFNDQKGFHVFDSSKHSVSFVKTCLTLFNRIEYNDKDVEPTETSGLEGTYVKVVVINKTDPYKYEKFLTNIISQNPADLKITDIENDFDNVDIDEELDLEDTKTLIEKFIDQSETNLDKSKLKDILKTMYMKALETVQ